MVPLEVVKETMFVIQLLHNMKIFVKLPVMVKVNNVGAMFMSGIITAMSHTKYVHIRYKYVIKYV